MGAGAQRHLSLSRRKAVLLALLAEAKRALPGATIGHLAFLLRHESCLREDKSFFDFLPMEGRPISFSLNHDLDMLREAGILRGDGDRWSLAFARTEPAKRWIGGLPEPVLAAVRGVCRRFGRMSREGIAQDVGQRYPRYFHSKQRTKDWDRDLFSRRRWAGQPPSHRRKTQPELLEPQESEGADASFVTPPSGPSPIFTAGYEGCSVEAFLDELLVNGIRLIADVRSNPSSRKYGFSRRSLEAFSQRVGLEYRNFPSLGIPGKARKGLDGFASYQRLLDSYERQVISRQAADVSELSSLAKASPTVLVCKEQDVRYCHRSRLATAVAEATGLAIRHLDTLGQQNRGAHARQELKTA